ncbi:hypothetical protein N0V90_010072 [Kalmusia sp. IMI 367209]|nr:hypothetical protein N0V90_010072 [Kalmusia sp. IMI 367209]
MPVSHIGLTVSHLPTSCSFFLSALQPLGYRYIGQQGNQIGLGIHDADFFLCQETPGRAAVRDFYAAALTAGGRPNGAPASRSDDDGHFNAAILDLDGNSIEVVFRNGPDFRDDGTVIEHSRVITWRRTVSESYHDDRSVASSRTTRSVSKQTVAPAAPTVISKAPSAAPSVASKPPSIARSVSEPIAVPQAPTPSESGDGAAKKIIGTLLGAAAGAAVAYAMVASERDSAKKEADFNAFKTAKAAVASVAQFAQTNEQPKLSMQDPQPVYETQPKQLPVHRNISDTDSQYSSPQARSAYVQRAIEAAPSVHSQSPPYASKAPTQVSVSRQLEYVPARSVASSRAGEQAEYAPAHSVAPSRAAELRAIEYVPAASVAPSRSQFSAHRSVTSPELPTVEKARSTVSKAQSAAPSSFISTFVPDEFQRRNTEGSVASHHSSKSKAKSHASRHTSHTKHSSSSRSRGHSPSPSKAPSDAPSKAPSKVGSIVGSILGRDTKSIVTDPFRDEYEIEEYTDDDDYTIAPSDSISNAGSSSRRSHRSHRSSKHSSAGSSASKHSSHSRSSKHSSKSHKSSRSSRSSEYHTADERLPSVVSEPSDASTVKPLKSKSGSSSRAPERKDSVTQYDGMFNNVQYGSGTVPVRGITPSMINGGKEEKVGKEGKGKSMIGYAMAQKLRAFEG